MKTDSIVKDNNTDGEHEDSQQILYIDSKLDEADEFANSIKKRLSHEEVFENIRSNLSKKQ